MKEVESILQRKFQRDFQKPGSSLDPSQDINFIHDTLLLKLEKISERSENILVQYQVMRLMDLIMKNRLLTFEQKETSALIYFINNVFLLHDILIGSAIAKRMVQRAKPLLHYVLKRSKVT